VLCGENKRCSFTVYCISTSGSTRYGQLIGSVLPRNSMMNTKQLAPSIAPMIAPWTDRPLHPCAPARACARAHRLIGHCCQTCVGAVVAPPASVVTSSSATAPCSFSPLVSRPLVAAFSAASAASASAIICSSLSLPCAHNRSTATVGQPRTHAGCGDMSSVGRCVSEAQEPGAHRSALRNLHAVVLCEAHPAGCRV
jgi:hypothetical protein